MANYQNLGLTYNRDTLFIGSHLGSASSVVPLWVAPCKCELISIKLLNGAAIAAHTENYGTLTITNELTDASGTTALTSDTTKTVAVTALVERTLADKHRREQDRPARRGALRDVDRGRHWCRLDERFDHH